MVEQKEPLPCPSFFVHKLFYKYASNDSINEKKIEQLLAKLKIGKHNQHEGTGGHYGGHDHLDHNDHQRHRRHIVTRTSFPSLTVNKILSTAHMEVKQPVSNRYRRHAEDPDDHDDDDEDDDRDHDHNGHEDSLTKSRYEKVDCLKYIYSTLAQVAVSQLVFQFIYILEVCIVHTCASNA